MENVNEQIRKELIKISNNNLLLRSELDKLRLAYAQLLDKTKACKCLQGYECNRDSPPMEKLWL